MNNSLESLTKTSSSSFPDSESPETLYKVSINGKKKLYACIFQDCGKEFRYKSEISRHVATHLSKRPHICPYEDCHKGFKRADALENHVRTHTKEAPYVCKECGKMCTTKASLRYHVLEHKDQKVHRCPFPGCNKAFITVFQLKQHEKSACVHKKISFGNDLTNSDVNNINPIETHHNKESAEMPPFFRNTLNDSNIKIPGNYARGPDGTQEILGERIRDIINENSLLKRRLELSTNIISLLHQKIRFESFQVSEYPQTAEMMTEGFLRFPFYSNADM